MAEIEEVITVKVIEFNRDEKRILVSHLRYLEDINKEADEKVKEEKAKERAEIQKVVKKTQSSVEKSTLGDLADFTELKEKIQDSDEE
jgi:small subunit ribosomal protein S1